MEITAAQAAKNYTDEHGGIAYHNERLGVSVVIDKYSRVHEFGGGDSHAILVGDRWVAADDDD